MGSTHTRDSHTGVLAGKANPPERREHEALQVVQELERLTQEPQHRGESRRVWYVVRSAMFRYAVQQRVICSDV